MNLFTSLSDISLSKISKLFLHQTFKSRDETLKNITSFLSKIPHQKALPLDTINEIVENNIILQGYNGTHHQKLSEHNHWKATVEQHLLELLKNGYQLIEVKEFQDECNWDRPAIVTFTFEDIIFIYSPNE